MRKITLARFLNTLKSHLDSEEDFRLVWFFGAGCSISSGIPGAQDLVREWLPRLKRLETGTSDDVDAWAAKYFEGYHPERLEQVYGEVINALFPLPRDRQSEIERITSDCDPAVGYAVFAVLAADASHGPKTNVVVTTNFDDLVADSLYLLTRQKPLVIAHENLAQFARASRRRPLVVKVHGDARLAPRNTAEETSQLDPRLASAVRGILDGGGLVFCGYAGNDESIAEFLQGFPADAFPFGVYWVGETVPNNAVGQWIANRADSFHIEHQDFDALFIQLASTLDLKLPDSSRFTELFDSWEERLKGVLADAGQSNLRPAADRLLATLEGLNAEREARRLAKAGDISGATAAYERAAATSNNDPRVLRNYAHFLTNSCSDYDGAQELYELALTNDPNNANNLTSYANFMRSIRKDHDKAQELYELALTNDPNNANNLTSYANFMRSIRKDHDKAQELYELALTNDPNNAYALGSYASFLTSIRKDHDKAQELYERALTNDPNKPYALGSYANFLTNIRKDHDKAQELYERALTNDPNKPYALGSYANFLTNIRNDHDKAQELYERALTNDPNNTNNLTSYANFLTNTRNDHDKAQELYERALTNDPNDPYALGSYANFLTNTRNDHDKAQELYERALTNDPNNTILLGNFAQLAFAVADDAKGVRLAKVALSDEGCPATLRVEILCALAAHTGGSSPKPGLELRSALEAGARSPGWSFGGSLDRLRKERDPRLPFFEQLASVICDGEDLASLEPFTEWGDWHPRKRPRKTQ
ncbi:Sel1 repeat-containing protein [Propionicimonas paludicola]|uniref:Sel1 repeat-containing protein n=1 Tax=Propionicimonas paludicola TaxID=185243 RepID=A0A2A9CUE3_9ACTN|nr:tetratricopeptide repeat protein [Propionicimonas paludicola]PFG18008.1 Sel1 repeat-containing protein [Propionicimonas paludicola]